MDDEKKRFVEKVLKLFALGDSGKTVVGTTTNTSETEMEAAVGRARQMMLDHNITEADLKAHSEKGQKVAHVIHNAVAWTLKRKSFAKYDNGIAYAVDAICDTRNYVQTHIEKGRWYVSRRFLGTETDVAVATRLFMVLMNEMHSMARRRFGPGWSSSHSNYAIGLAVRVMQRAQAAKADHLLPARQQTLALVLRDKKAAVDQEAENLGIVQKKGRQTRIRDVSAYMQGQRDAEAVDLGNPKRRIE